MKSGKFKALSSSVVSFVLCMAILLTTVIPPITASAVNGSFTGGQICNGYRLKLDYVESAMNPKINTSRMTVTLYLVQDRGYDLYIGTRSATITINGVKTTISNIPAIRNTGNVTTKLGTASVNVVHNADGTKSIPISATFNMNATLAGTYYGTMSASKTITLNWLDRNPPNVSVKFNSSTVNSVNLTATANTACDNWQYSTNGGSSWVPFGSTGTSNTFTISNLSGGTAYSVVVRARKTSNEITSAKSSAVTATTKPTPPDGLSVGDITQTSAVLSWNAVNGANSYKTYLNGNLTASGITATNYTFTGLTANTSYAFTVSATSAGGDSAASTPANCITLPNIPTGLNVTNQTENSVALSWSYDNGGSAEGTVFNISRDGKSIGSSTVASYTDDSYENTDCTYTVSAATSAGRSAESPDVSVEHIPLSIALSTTNNSTYATITPSFTGGYNNTFTAKWAYGNKDASYFSDNGTEFEGDLYVTRNGVYTVYAEASQGEYDLKTITVSDIYTDNTIGAYTQTFTDLSVDSTDIPVSFERTYNSMDNTSNIFGNGWSLNYAKKTVLSDDGTVRLVYLPNGYVNYFRVNEDNTYSPIKNQNRLISNGNTFTLFVKDEYIYTYTNGYLTSIKDAHNNEIIIELNSQNLPRKVIDSVSREYLITYNSDNKITSVTDPAGRVVAYEYNDNGNLSCFKAFGNIASERYVYSDGLLTKITYVQNNTDTEITYYSNNQAASIKQNGETAYYYYRVSSKGEISISEYSGESASAVNEYDSYGQLIIDSDGYSYEYNLNGKISKIEKLNTDRILIEFEYDDTGNLIEKRTAENDILKEVISYEYTYFENTNKIYTSKETTESYTYDENNAAITDRTTVESTYNIYGDLLSEETTHNNVAENIKAYTYLPSGLLSSEIADGKTVEYTYDTNRYVTNIRTIENEVETNVSISYNIIGQTLLQTENGNTTSFVYDIFGNIIKETQTDGVKTVFVRSVFDDKSRLIQRIYTNDYNEEADTLSEYNQYGLCISNIYSNENVGERYTYDANGNVLTYISSFGVLTTYTYDYHNNLVKSVTDNNVTRYIYSYPTADGQTDKLVQVIYPEDYEEEHDTLTITENSIVNSYGITNVGDRYTYDSDGKLSSVTDKKGNVLEYNTNEEIVKITKADGTVFEYNNGKTTTENYSNDLTRTFEYTIDDNDSDNENADSNSNDDVSENENTEPTIDQTIITASNGIIIKYTKDDNGNVTGYDIENSNININKNYSYTYDDNGNILTISLNGSLQQSFVYNSSNELIRVNDAIGDKTITYEYDFVGNITSVKTYDYSTGELGAALTEQTYSYNAENQRTDLSYDANGNLTAHNGYTLGWNGRRLTGATKDGYTIAYSYDCNGIRTSKTINGNTITYTVDVNNNVVSQTDGINTLNFVYDSDNSPIYFTYNNSTYYYEKNLQGDIVALLDVNGNTVVEYTYDIWGKLLGITGTLASTIGEINPLRYRGYYYDTETQLYYLQSRYYAPDLMRFISQDDPVLSNDQGEPIGSNLYVYCLNNPVMFIDRTGHDVGALYLSYYFISVLSSALSGIITSISSSIAAIKTAIVSSFIPAICIAATAVAIVGITYAVKKAVALMSMATSTIAAVKTSVQKGGIDTKKLRDYSVYVIAPKGSVDVEYVGITKNFSARQSKHQGGKKAIYPYNKYKMTVVATGLSKSQARALEQTLITAYGLDTLKNIINSISPKKWNTFTKEFKQMQSLICSWYDPE